MSDFVHLVGSEAVQRAAASMADTAHRIENSVSTLDSALWRHLNRFEELVQRLEAIATIPATEEPPDTEKPAPDPLTAQVIDLMEALKASLSMAAKKERNAPA